MGFLSYPNTFRTKATGNDPAADVDANFDAVSAVVNGGLDSTNIPALTGFEPALGNPPADNELLVSTAAGVRSWIPSPQGFTNRQIFNISGVWSRPPGITQVRIQAWGAGGGNNGAGGGYGEDIFSGINGDITISVGIGGAGSGGSGGATTVSGGGLPANLTANGGGASSGAGGTASGFGLALTGQGGIGGGAASPLGGLGNGQAPGSGGGNNGAGANGRVIIWW